MGIPDGGQRRAWSMHAGPPEVTWAEHPAPVDDDGGGWGQQCATWQGAACIAHRLEALS